MLIEKETRKSRPAHLAMIRRLPCLIVGNEMTVEAHHLLRIEDTTVEYGRKLKNQHGMGKKVDDKFTLPLDRRIHDALHDVGAEKRFLAMFCIPNPEEVAANLYLSLTPWEAEDYIRRTFARNWPQNRRHPEIMKIFGIKAHSTSLFNARP